MLTHPYTSRLRAARSLRVRTAQHGAALLEALVAILLLMLGILALIGLQGRMVSASTEAQMRGEAAYLADQLIGQMWVSQTTADEAYLSNYVVTEGKCATSGNKTCADWTALVAATLPTGTSAVAIAGNVVTVTVFWTPANSTQHRVDVVATIAH